MFYTTYQEIEEGEFASLLKTISMDYIVRTDADGNEFYGFSDEAARSLFFHYLEIPGISDEVIDPVRICSQWCEYTAAELAGAYAGDERGMLSKMHFAQNAAEFAIDVSGGVALAALTGDIAGAVKDCIQGAAHFATGLRRDWRDSMEAQQRAASEVVGMLDQLGEYEILYIEGGSYLLRRHEARNVAPIRTTYPHVGRCLNVAVPDWHVNEVLERALMMSAEGREIVRDFHDSPRHVDFIPSTRMLTFLWSENSPRHALGEIVSCIHAVLFSDEVNYLYKDRPDFWEELCTEELGPVGTYGTDEERYACIQGLIDAYGTTLGGAVNYIGPLDGEDLIGLANGNILICRPYFTLPPEL